MRRSCWRMMSPHSWRQAQMRRTSSSRPRSWRVLFSCSMDPPLDHRLRGDAGVVGARHPEGLAALHAAPADEDVLQRVVERVAQVQRVGHVGRRNDDRERLARRVGLGVEEAPLLPCLVEALFDGGRVVDLGQRLLAGPFAWSPSLPSCPSPYSLEGASTIAHGVSRGSDDPSLEAKALRTSARLTGLTDEDACAALPGSRPAHSPAGCGCGTVLEAERLNACAPYLSSTCTRCCRPGPARRRR